MNTAISVMLERAVDEKTRALPRWTGNVAKRWLLLLNAYPLVDNVGDVERALKKLTRSNPNLCGFDGVFWSGYSNRELVAIPTR